MNIEYHYLLMSQIDLLQNEVVEEVVRERATSYFLNKKNQDFWIVLSPRFLDNQKIKTKLHNSSFYQQKKYNGIISKNTSEFYGTIISTNKEFITWISLRLGYFENIEDLDQPVLKKIVSNGVYGKILNSDLNNVKYLFTSNNKPINPNLVLNKYDKLLNVCF